jgi:3-hydroxyisobutyrate dehydrogenase
MATSVALLGTGIMGSGMARNIAKAGLSLRVWNRTKSRAMALAEHGAVVADRPAEAVRGADIVVTMLFDAVSVENAMAGALTDLPRDAIWLQTSTVGVAGTARLAELAYSHGIAFVDAPVLGTRQPAEHGALIVLASGAPELQDMVRPVLDAIGAKTIWIGDAPGDGSRFKLVLNAWVLSLTAATAQSIALAKALGLDQRRFLETISGSPTDCAYAQLKGAAMINGEFEPAFGLDGAAKDSDLILAAMHDTGTNPALMAAVSQLMHNAVDLGHAKADMAAVWHAF